MAFLPIHQKHLTKFFYLPFLALVAVVIVKIPAYAQDHSGNDPATASDRPTLTRAINIDEASVNNSVYVTGSIDNSFAQGHSINLQAEGIIRLDKDWGLDLSFPQILLQEPIGQTSAALGPIGAGLRYVFGKFRNREADSAGIFSVEAQGFYWATPNDQYSGVGSSYTLQGLAGVRFGRVYLQGNYGYSGAFDQNFQNNIFAFSALGYALASHWALQVEADYTGDVLPDNGGIDSQWVLVPQLGFKNDGWLLEVGEALNPSQAGSSTDFVLEKDFF